MKNYELTMTRNIGKPQNDKSHRGNVSKTQMTAWRCVMEPTLNIWTGNATDWHYKRKTLFICTGAYQTVWKYILRNQITHESQGRKQNVTKRWRLKNVECRRYPADTIVSTRQNSIFRTATVYATFVKHKMEYAIHLKFRNETSRFSWNWTK